MLSKKTNNIITIASILSFVALFVASVLTFWKYVIDKLSSATNFGVPLDVSVGYIVISFVFVAVLIALSVVGFLLRNKYLVLVSFGYQLLLVFGLIILVFFVGGQIANQSLYTFLLWTLMVLVAPIFGAALELGGWFVGVLLVLFIATIVFLVLIFKRKK